MTKRSDVECHLSTGDVAKRLGFSNERVRQLIAKGYFPGAWRLSGKRAQWRIPESDVAAFVESQKG